MGLIKTYSAKEIHDAIYAKNIAMITAMIELQKKEMVSCPDTISKEYDRLNALGLANTKNAQILKKKIDEVNTINKDICSYNAAIDKQNEFCQFVKEMIEVFGHNTLLVRFDDFERIVRKYNLTCGLLKHYTGSIPKNNIEELERAKKNIEVSESFGFTYINDYGVTRGVGSKYPLLKENIYNLYYVREINSGVLTKNERKGLKLFPFVIIANRCLDRYKTICSDKVINNRYIEVDSNYSKLFIVAPYKEMLNGVKFTNFVRSTDPFICSYTPFGIMIHTAWGDESEDEILSKYYEQLNALK